MSASKKYMNEMIARYSLPGTKPMMMNRPRYSTAQRLPVVQPQQVAQIQPQPQIIKQDPNIEIAKLQRQRQAQNIQRINASRKLIAARINKQVKRQSTSQKFVPDRRRPYDDVKVSRLARGTSRIVNAYDRYRKM